MAMHGLPSKSTRRFKRLDDNADAEDGDDDDGDDDSDVRDETTTTMMMTTTMMLTLMKMTMTTLRLTTMTRQRWDFHRNPNAANCMPPKRWMSTILNRKTDLLSRPRSALHGKKDKSKRSFSYLLWLPPPRTLPVRVQMRKSQGSAQWCSMHCSTNLSENPEPSQHAKAPCSRIWQTDQYRTLSARGRFGIPKSLQQGAHPWVRFSQSSLAEHRAGQRDGKHRRMSHALYPTGLDCTWESGRKFSACQSLFGNLADAGT